MPTYPVVFTPNHPSYYTRLESDETINLRPTTGQAHIKGPGQASSKNYTRFSTPPVFMCPDVETNPAPTASPNGHESQSMPPQDVARTPDQWALISSPETHSRGKDQPQHASHVAEAASSGEDTDQYGSNVLLEACNALSSCLNGSSFKWVVVGGAGMVALGSGRATMDVDIVIHPPQEMRKAKDILKGDARFFVDPRTRRTRYTSDITGEAVDVDFLSYPGTFKTRFDESTPLMQTDSGIPLLAPALFLECKCASLLSRSYESKKRSDAQDVRFLLGYIFENNVRTKSSDVPSATKEFQQGFEAYQPGTLEFFQRVGL